MSHIIDVADHYQSFCNHHSEQSDTSNPNNPSDPTPPTPTMQRKETSINAAYEAYLEHDNESDEPCVRYLNALYLIAHRGGEFQFHITYLHLLLDRIFGAALRDAVIRALPQWLLNERRDGETTVQPAMVRHSRYRMTARQYLHAIRLNEVCIIAYMGHFDGTYLRDFDVIDNPNRPQKLLLDFSLLEQHFDAFYRSQFVRNRLVEIFRLGTADTFLHRTFRSDIALTIMLPRMNHHNIYWFVFCVKNIRFFLEQRSLASLTKRTLAQIAQYPTIRELMLRLIDTFTNSFDPNFDLARR